MTLAAVLSAVSRPLELMELELQVDELVTRTFAFPEIDEAMACCAAEQGARGMLVF